MGGSKKGSPTFYKSDNKEVLVMARKGSKRYKAAKKAWATRRKRFGKDGVRG